MEAIRQWFVEHDEGEFVIPPRDHPFSVVPPSSASQNVIYTTKPHVVRSGLPCGLIGRIGLPDESDVNWVRTILVGHRLIFLGDVDPSDLLVFAWLRSRIDVSFGGLSDSLIKRCGVTMNDRITIAQSDAESAAMSLLADHVPDLAELVGPECSAMLRAGRKLDVEAVTSFATVEPIGIFGGVTVSVTDEYRHLLVVMRRIHMKVLNSTGDRCHVVLKSRKPNDAKSSTCASGSAHELSKRASV